jgi:predicted nucleic acid-binding protein
VHLLDTDVVSNFRKKAHPNLVSWLINTEPNQIAVSAITVFEIQAGINYVRNHNPAKAGEIGEWLNAFVLAGGLSIISIDARIAQIYADMFTTPELRNFLTVAPKSKRPKSGADLIIAATAITHNAAIVTMNHNDFEHIHKLFPIPGLYNPLNEKWILARQT